MLRVLLSKIIEPKNAAKFASCLEHRYLTNDLSQGFFCEPEASDHAGGV